MSHVVRQATLRSVKEFVICELLKVSFNAVELGSLGFVESSARSTDVMIHTVAQIKSNLSIEHLLNCSEIAVA